MGAGSGPGEDATDRAELRSSGDAGTGTGTATSEDSGVHPRAGCLDPHGFPIWPERGATHHDAQAVTRSEGLSTLLPSLEGLLGLPASSWVSLGGAIFGSRSTTLLERPGAMPITSCARPAVSGGFHGVDGFLHQVMRGAGCPPPRHSSFSSAHPHPAPGHTAGHTADAHLPEREGKHSGLLCFPALASIFFVVQAWTEVLWGPGGVTPAPGS